MIFAQRLTANSQLRFAPPKLPFGQLQLFAERYTQSPLT